MALNSMNFHTLAPMAASGLLNSLFAGIGMAAVGWLVSRIAGRNSSQTRFLVWIITFIAMAFLPLVGSVVASSWAAGPTLATGPLTLPEWFASWLVVGWMIGAVLGTLHIANGLYRLRRLRATCVPVATEQLDPALRASLCEIQSRRSVRLCISDAVRVPAAIGYFRPLVVFPSWALTDIPTAELNAILVHELAHLRRYDDWTNLAQKLVKAILFFHPAVWFIESRLTLEREMACDEAVLAASYSPRAYAESLVNLAEKSFLRRGVHLAQAAVSQVEQLKLRLAEILRRDRLTSGQGRGRVVSSAVAFMSLAAILCVFGIARAPQLVAFTSGLPQVASTTANSQAIDRLEDTRLQPVSLNYSDQPRQAAPAVRKVKMTPQGVQQRAAMKSTALLALSGRERDITDEPVPPAIRAAANFPMTLNATSVLVVFQGEQFGVNGVVYWRVTVIHLTPAQQRAITGENPKKI